MCCFFRFSVNVFHLMLRFLNRQHSILACAEWMLLGYKFKRTSLELENDSPYTNFRSIYFYQEQKKWVFKDSDKIEHFLQMIKRLFCLEIVLKFSWTTMKLELVHIFHSVRSWPFSDCTHTFHSFVRNSFFLHPQISHFWKVLVME